MLIPHGPRATSKSTSEGTSTITFAPLSTVDPDDLIALMNDPRVRRHLPLAPVVFGPSEYARFIEEKECHWTEHGYGPRAFYVEGAFAGWGGLQAQGEDIDVGLVLHPRYWGLGPGLYAQLTSEAFQTLGARSVIVLLPTSRRNVAAVQRAGFAPDGEVTIAGACFRRFRLHSPAKPGSSSSSEDSSTAV